MLNNFFEKNIIQKKSNYRDNHEGKSIKIRTIMDNIHHNYQKYRDNYR